MYLERWKVGERTIGRFVVFFICIGMSSISNKFHKYKINIMSYYISYLFSFLIIENSKLYDMNYMII